MECYICCDKETKNNPFCKQQVCKCKGTNKIHESCLNELKIKCGNICSICKSSYREIIYETNSVNSKKNKSPNTDYNIEDVIAKLNRQLIENQIMMQEIDKQSCCTII
jgi:hypothetical protein